MNPQQFVAKLQTEFIPALERRIKKEHPEATIQCSQSQFGIDVLIDSDSGHELYCIDPFTQTWTTVYG